MREHEVRVHSSASTPARTELLAWQLALVAVDVTTPDDDVVEMIINRVIHAAMWPLRQVGLDPHRALDNAMPDPKRTVNNAKPDPGRARAARSGSA